MANELMPGEFLAINSILIFLIKRSVVVNGSVEHIHSNGHRVEYRVGDCFGVQPICQAQFNDGEIKTLTDDCEFVLVGKCVEMGN